MRVYAGALGLVVVLIVAAACGTPAEPPPTRTATPAAPCPVDAEAVAVVVGAPVIDVKARSALPIRGCQFALPPPPGPAGSVVAETLRSKYPAQLIVAIDARQPGDLPLSLRDPELSRSCSPGPGIVHCSLFQQEIAIAETADRGPHGVRWSVRVDQFTAYKPLGGWQGDPQHIAEGVLALLTG